MHTVIVGGGFAGVRAALEISKRQLGKITLISDQPYFLHHATLYATATGRSEKESVITLEDVFANHHDVTVVQDTLTSIDPDRKLALGAKKQYPYDTLVLALGSSTDYFSKGRKNNHSFGLHTLEDVRTFRRHIMTEVKQDKHLDKNYVIIGGGETGVELAGALALYLQELAHLYLSKRTKISIVLVESQERILPHSSRTASKRVASRLARLGVTVLAGTHVERVGAHSVKIGERELSTETIMWTNGTVNNSFFKEHSNYFILTPQGRVTVNPYLEAYKDIYVLGDNAAIRGAGTAHAAIDMGTFIAKHLVRKITDRPLKPFAPHSHTTNIPVGDGWAYIEKFGVYVDGPVGHWLRRHLVLRSYRNIVSRNMALRAWRAHNQPYNETGL